MSKPKVVFVTGNANKLSEVRAILGDSVDLEAKSIDLPELQGTIEEISKDKCRRAAEIVSNTILLELYCREINELLTRRCGPAGGCRLGRRYLSQL